MSDDLVAPDAGDGEAQRPESAVQKELPGRLLQSKRQELNWSVEDVAHALHLAPRQIHALEADNYGALPGMAIARGFLRSYAKLLKLDPAPLVEMIANEAGARNEDASLRRALPDKPFYANRSLTWGAKPRAWARGGLVGVMLILAALLLAWKADWLAPSWVDEVRNLLPEQAAAPEGKYPEGVNGEAENNATPASSGSTPASANAQALMAEPTEASSANVATAPDASGLAIVQGAAAPSNERERAGDTPGTGDLLVLKLREDSWIEIRDAHNKPLLSRLVKAGESETVPVRGPLKLKIGNAAGVDAQLRGVPIELSASAKNNVARLTVN